VAIDDPHVIHIAPIPAGYMPEPAPIETSAAPFHRNAPRQRSMTQVAAGLQAGFDAHVRRVGNESTTSYDPDD
jgi:hypothetical protein